jgi:hypothetical protein
MSIQWRPQRSPCRGSASSLSTSFSYQSGDGEILRLRRQADQIEIEPADEHVPRSLRLRCEAGLLVGLGEESVDRVFHP